MGGWGWRGGGGGGGGRFQYKIKAQEKVKSTVMIHTIDVISPNTIFHKLKSFVA